MPREHIRQRLERRPAARRHGHLHVQLARQLLGQHRDRLQLTSFAIFDWPSSSTSIRPFTSTIASFSMIDAYLLYASVKTTLSTLPVEIFQHEDGHAIALARFHDAAARR